EVGRGEQTTVPADAPQGPDGAGLARTLRLSNGALSETQSVTYAQNVYGFLDTFRTDSYTVALGKWRVYNTGNRSQLTRTWPTVYRDYNVYGETAASDTWLSKSWSRYVVNPDGRADAETLGPVPTAQEYTKSTGTDTYAIYLWVGEQLATGKSKT